jgi:hypothetical protein
VLRRSCPEYGQRFTTVEDEVGLAIRGGLREWDVVAYLRFASVYRAFDPLADFEAEAVYRPERNLIMRVARYALALLLLTLAALAWPDTLAEEVAVALLLEAVLAVLRQRDRDRGA